MKVELDWYNYATKTVLKKTTGFDKSEFVKKILWAGIGSGSITGFDKSEFAKKKLN